MPVVNSIETTYFESDDVRPEFEDIQTGLGPWQTWDILINRNFKILGQGDTPMRWPFRVGDTELTIDGTFLPKFHNSTLLLLNHTTEGLSVFIQSNDSAGVWVRKT